jgi:hypothetical protein
MMRVGILLACVVGALGGLPRPAAGQAPHGGSVELLPGARVRVSSPTAGRVVGTLMRASDDSVRIGLVGGTSVDLPTASLSALEVSAGVRRNGWRGAGIGLLVGAGVGGTIGLATYRRAECYDNVVEGFFCDLVNRTSRSVTVISDAAMAGTAGAIVGALVGHAGREQWVRVPLARDGLRLGLVPWPAATPHAAARVGVALTF